MLDYTQSNSTHSIIATYCPCMAPALTGVVQGTISAATYAATEKLAYARNPSLKDTLQVGITSGILAGGTQYIGQKLGKIQCFIAGTLVATKTGLVPIEDIKPGDLVWATNEKTGETALKEVVQLFRNETTEWIHVTVNGEEIVCTPEHPFYSPVKGWTSAIDLRAGDRLQLLNGEYVVVEQVQHELLENPEVTYNFEVEDFHTYYVGNEPVLVHNECTPSNSKNYSPEKIADKYNITVEQYHKQVKPEIIRQSPPKAHIVGKNPNIMLNKAGEIGYQGANGRGFQNTGFTMGKILKKLGLR